EKLLGQVERIHVTHTIMGCKKPSSAALFHLVQAVAGDRLQRLNQEEVHIPQQELPNGCEFVGNRTECANWDSGGDSLELHERTIRRRVPSKDRFKAHESF